MNSRDKYRYMPTAKKLEEEIEKATNILGEALGTDPEYRSLMGCAEALAGHVETLRQELEEARMSVTLCDGDMEKYLRHAIGGWKLFAENNAELADAHAEERNRYKEGLEKTTQAKYNHYDSDNHYEEGTCNFESLKDIARQALAPDQENPADVCKECGDAGFVQGSEPNTADDCPKCQPPKKDPSLPSEGGTHLVKGAVMGVARFLWWAVSGEGYDPETLKGD